MKLKNILYLAFGALLCTACFDDDSTTSDYDMLNIAIAEMEDCTITSYAGEKLEVTPEIASKYSESEMEYKWEMVLSTAKNNGEGGIPFDEIGNERNLSYEVNLAPGKYVVRLVATAKATGISASQSFEMTVITPFSQGFYIMKQTANGNTEVDMMQEDGTFKEDLMTKIDGQPLQGKPVALSVAFYHWYINDDTKEKVYENMICVTRENGQITLKRCSDLATIFTEANLTYGGLKGEQPYVMTTASWYSYLVTDKGLRYIGAGGPYAFGSNSGRYGVISYETGGSKLFCIAGSHGNHVYWDEQNKYFYSEYYGSVTECYNSFYGMDDFSNYTCLNGGYNNGYGATIYVMRNNATGDVELWQLKGSSMVTYMKLSTIPANEVMAKCNWFSVNGRTAYYVYGTDGTNLYAANFTDGQVQTLKAEGLTAGNITYVSNQYYMYFNGVDYLLIGTEQGGKYTLHFYKMLGGAPDGAPVFKVSGTGTLKSVRYVVQDWSDYGIFSIND